jgi:GTP cyclohydrolase I
VTASEHADAPDLDAIAGAVRTILEAIGEDPDREGLVGTPQRVARMYAEVFGGLRQNGNEVVAYTPRGTVTGLSKLARLVDAYARRPQMQERLTTQIANTLMEALDPYGVLVVVEAGHLCMSMRGIKKPDAITVTSAVRGSFCDDVASRSEAMALLFGGR